MLLLPHVMLLHLTPPVDLSLFPHVPTRVQVDRCLTLHYKVLNGYSDSTVPILHFHFTPHLRAALLHPALTQEYAEATRLHRLKWTCLHACRMDQAAAQVESRGRALPNIGLSKQPAAVCNKGTNATLYSACLMPHCPCVSVCLESMQCMEGACQHIPVNRELDSF
jgi:hypothetical protein